MKLILKTISSIVAICLLNIGLVYLLSINMQIPNIVFLLLVIEICVLICYLLYKTILKPLNELYNSLEVINFDNDIIDFTQVDSLDENGFSEIKAIIRKYKYLLDIITERINRYNNETYKSEHDALTGCYNRNHLSKVKSRYEQQRSFFVVFIDVNNLKRMNDEFGHEAGDSLLKNVASKMQFWNSYGDVYRLGGDEFMIVLINKRTDYCQRLLKQWYPTVGVLNREADGFKCVLSYGVAVGSHGSNFDAVEKEADDNMYKMKVRIKQEFGEPMR